MYGTWLLFKEITLEVTVVYFAQLQNVCKLRVGL